MEEKNWFYKHVVSKFEKFFYLAKKSIYFAWYRHHFLIPPRVLWKYIHSFFIALKRGGNTSNLYMNQSAYLKWWEEESSKEIVYQELEYRPLISFIVPTYNVSRQLLSECLDSLLKQSYDHFEICIADDHSSNEETLDTLREYEQKYDCIHVVYRNENGMISEASNTAIGIAKGEFIALIDNDDVIEKDALYYVVEALNKNPKLDLIYSDEDKIDYTGKYMEPHFKPDYSPDTLMSINYICHLSVLRKSLIEELNGFRKEYDGSQDYDLFLRVVEKTDQIYHIEKVLYHWRQTADSTSAYLGSKGYAYEAGMKALQDALDRRNLKGQVLENPKASNYIAHYGNDNELVSIIIPIKDKADITKRCIDSIYEKSTYRNFEIILIDNGSTETKTKEMLADYESKYDNFTTLYLDCAFNYSYLNNEAVKIAKGDYLLFLNNDTEVMTPEFMEEMLGYARLDHVGCVGIKLLYPDKLVQHAGIVLGNGGLAGHIYVADSYYATGLFGRLVTPYDYTAVTAACLMMKKSKFNDVGGFDETLTVALNDVDLNLKILDKGYYNVCLSNIEMMHYESKSRGYEATKEKNERFNREQEYLKNKWQETLDRDRFFSPHYF